RLMADGQLQDLLGRGVGDVGQAGAARLAGQGGHDAGLVIGDQDGGLLGHWTLASWLDRKIHTGAYLQRCQGVGTEVHGSPRMWGSLRTRSALTSPKVDPWGVDPLRRASLARGVSASGSGSAW